MRARFFRLWPHLEDDTPDVDLVSHEGLSFTMGARFAVPPREPVRFRAGRGAARLGHLHFPVPLMSAALVAHLRALGVTTLDDYEARVSGKGAPAGFRAVNVTAALSCADLERSEFEHFEGMYFFDRLVLDARRAKGAPLFRVKEALEYVVVPATLARAFDAARFPDVRLTPLES